MPKRDRVVIGMATCRGREGVLQQALESLRNQTHPPDAIHLYDNSKQPDRTDNGKFHGLTLETKPCYYLTCDDDIIYPPDYIEGMVAAIKRLGGVVTHYGRKLRGEAPNYYHANHRIHRLIEATTEWEIDIPGTGVSGWYTGELNFVCILHALPYKMTDCHLGLACAENGVKVTALAHPANHIREIPLPRSLTIHGTEVYRDGPQTEIANQIWKLKYAASRKN